MNKIAFLFAGQGAQYVGMGKDLYEISPSARKIFTQANHILNFNITETIFNGPEEALCKTDVCQPAIFTTSIAITEALKEVFDISTLNIKATAGLSVGEYSAVAFSKALPWDKALYLVRMRGKFMQKACDARSGSMASVIGLDRTIVSNLCSEISNDNCVVKIGNINSPEQIVISGDSESIVRASELLKQKGAKKVIPLKVAGAFHSPLMQPAEEELSKELERFEFKKPLFPIISNVNADYVVEPELIRKNLSVQITSTVLWEDLMRKLLQDGFDLFVEVGPGKVLSGLLKRISPQARVFSIEDKESIDKLVSFFKEMENL